MLNLAHLPATVPPVPPVPGGVERLSVEIRVQERMTDTQRAASSRETGWMVAVRDRRDRAAFARLFDHYAPRLKAMVRRSGACAAEAEDIVQDVMLAVWQKAGQFDPERAHVSGWIYRIARNRQIDLARRRARPEPEELMPEQENVPESDQVVAMAQEADRLRRAIDRLTPEQKHMIEKAYLGDMSHVEIRDDTGLPLGTIKSRIRLGLERLRHELKELRQK